MTMPTDKKVNKNNTDIYDDNASMRPSEHKIPKQKTAVAISDQSDLDPEALAKIIGAGRGAWAEKIIDLAFQYNVPVREDSDLTELLAQFELDTNIPTEAIMAVAEILSYVYKLNETPEPLTGIFNYDE